MTGGVSKEELLARRTGEGIDPVIEFLVDQNFNGDIVDGLTRRDATLEMTHVRDVGSSGRPRPGDPGVGERRTAWFC